MKTQIITAKLSNEERETVILYDNAKKCWYLDTTVMKHFNRAKKKGWEQVGEIKTFDGLVVGGSFIAPAHSITIRGTEKRTMSDKQLTNLLNDEDEE